VLGHTNYIKHCQGMERYGRLGIEWLMPAEGASWRGDLSYRLVGLFVRVRSSADGSAVAG